MNRRYFLAVSGRMLGVIGMCFAGNSLSLLSSKRKGRGAKGKIAKLFSGNSLIKDAAAETRAAGREENEFDAIIIGSGFGGAVTACRLAEAGYKVLVLERGRRWQPKKFPHAGAAGLEATPYPRHPGEPLYWSDNSVFKQNGIQEIVNFRHMSIMKGSGVGGTSLVYAAVTVRPTANLFAEGWPRELSYNDLSPYYDDVDWMLESATVPECQQTNRTKTVKEAMEKAGYGDSFHLAPLAMSFKPGGLNPLPESIIGAERFTNKHGVKQGYCMNLGNCMLSGCDIDAKNALHLNYIPAAEQASAQVKKLHFVRKIIPGADGRYKVTFDRINLEDNLLIPGAAVARVVIVAAGSLGSTELLLRNRDEYKTLPGINKWLGNFWSGNGDFGGIAFCPNHQISPTKGPSITTYNEFDRATNPDEHFIIEDFGFPDFIRNMSATRYGRNNRAKIAKLLADIREFTRKSAGKNISGDPFSHVMIWGSIGKEASTGKLYMKKNRWFSDRTHLELDWNPDISKQLYSQMQSMMSGVIAETGGAYFNNPAYSLFRQMFSAHPLGGVPMGDAPGNGREWWEHGVKRNTEQAVVDHKGEVFGYQNLFVVDGSTVPRAIGRNPSMTIAALAERSSDYIIERLKNNKG